MKNEYNDGFSLEYTSQETNTHVNPDSIIALRVHELIATSLLNVHCVFLV